MAQIYRWGRKSCQSSFTSMIRIAGSKYMCTPSTRGLLIHPDAGPCSPDREEATIGIVSQISSNATQVHKDHYILLKKKSRAIYCCLFWESSVRANLGTMNYIDSGVFRL